jgi:branched-chain amino acid aminotransferase
MRTHNFASLNRRIVESSALHIPALASSSLYGKGIFTSVAHYDYEPFLWESHWRRLVTNSKKIRIDLSEFDNDTIFAALNDLVAQNAAGNGRARITFFDESATLLWPYETKRRTSMLITTADFRPVAKNFKLTVSPYLINSTSPLVGVKSNNYLEKVIAKDDAKQRGFDEGVQLNERGEITSACVANVFWLKNGKLFTPSLETGCLPGTTREFVLEKIDCREVAGGIDELRTADEIFLTSAGIGVLQVADFDGRKLQRIDHAIMKLVPSRQ